MSRGWGQTTISDTDPDGCSPRGPNPQGQGSTGVGAVLLGDHKAAARWPPQGHRSQGGVCVYEDGSRLFGAHASRVPAPSEAEQKGREAASEVREHPSG